MCSFLKARYFKSRMNCKIGIIERTEERAWLGFGSIFQFKKRPDRTDITKLVPV